MTDEIVTNHVKIPESVDEKLRILSRQSGISINDLITTAISSYLRLPIDMKPDIKITGVTVRDYVRGQIKDDQTSPSPLAEICVTASAKTLRQIGKFFKRIADEIQSGNPNDHYHFRQNTDKPDIIILNIQKDDIDVL